MIQTVHYYVLQLPLIVPTFALQFVWKPWSGFLEHWPRTNWRSRRLSKRSLKAFARTSSQRRTGFVTSSEALLMRLLESWVKCQSLSHGECLLSRFAKNWRKRIDKCVNWHMVSHFPQLNVVTIGYWVFPKHFSFVSRFEVALWHNYYCRMLFGPKKSSSIFRAWYYSFFEKVKKKFASKKI